MLCLLASIILSSGKVWTGADCKSSYHVLDQFPLTDEADVPTLWNWAALVTGFDQQNVDKEMMDQLEA